MAKRWNKGADRGNKLTHYRGFKGGSHGPAGPVNHIVHSPRRIKPDNGGDGVWIVVGADAPSNKTGQRQVHHFRTLADAHRAGFTWAT